MRTLGPVVVAVSLAFGGMHANAYVRPSADVLLLQAANKTATSRFTTQTTKSYTVTVSGMYTYDGAVGLADCGHADPAGPQAWTDRTNVVVDGRVAQCFAQDFSQTHSYTWTQPGTGRPFAFDIAVPFKDAADDTGYLVVTVVEN